jgi:hypothetical protein
MREWACATNVLAVVLPELPLLLHATIANEVIATPLRSDSDRAMRGQ